MFWYGRFHAILIVMMVSGLLMSFVFGSVSGAISTLIVVFGLRLLAGTLNIISKAFFPKPLFYDHKIID